MADTKGSALPSATPLATDEVYLIDDPLGTPSSKRATVASLVSLGDFQAEPSEGAFVNGDKTKLDGIETSATADQTDAEIETAYNNEVAIVSQADAEAGTGTAVRRWTPQRVSQAAMETATTSRQQVYNGTGSTLTKGTPIYLSGFNVGAGCPEVTTADADGSGTIPCAGVLEDDILNTATGWAKRDGEITGVDTSGMAINDPLYVSTSGVFTATAPTTGVIHEIGRVSRVDASNGEIIIGLKVSGLLLSDGTSFSDNNDNEILEVGVVSSAVNHVKVSNAVTGNSAKVSAAGGDTNVDLELQGKGTGVVKGHNEHIAIAVSDETTALTTGTAKTTFRMPYGFTLSEVRASVTTAPTGSVLTVDINEGGVTILSTKLTIDAGEKTSTTAATAAVISDSALADDAEITVDIDTVGSTVAGAGLKIYLIGKQ